MEASPELAISRRGFLVRGIFGAGLLAVGAGLAACGPGSREGEEAARLSGDRPRQLPPSEYVVLVAVAARMLPEGPEGPATAAHRVAVRVDRELGFHPPRLRQDVIGALRLIEWWPLVARGARFSRLDARTQDAELAALVDSRLAVRRSAFQGLKFLVMFFHYSQDAAWAGTGYDGPWVPRVPPATLA